MPQRLQHIRKIDCTNRENPTNPNNSCGKTPGYDLEGVAKENGGFLHLINSGAAVKLHCSLILFSAARAFDICIIGVQILIESKHRIAHTNNTRAAV